MEINYINSLEKKVEVYKKRYIQKPFICFFKLIWWSVAYFISKVAQVLIVKSNKNSNKLYIGVAMGGGFGDILIGANYIYHLRKYLSPLDVHIDCYSGNLGAAKNTFINSNLIDGLYKNVYHNKAKKYDFYISIIESFPNVINYNKKKIEHLAPKLLLLIDECLKFEKIIEKTIKYSPKNNSAAYIASLIQGRNRVQINDVGNILGIEPVLKFTPSINLDEQEVLNKFNLNNLKYITINRCVGELNNFWDSNKMWPLEYCNELVSLIKANYRDVKIIQVGHSLERSPVISNTDACLVGKTSFEEAKVILKNSFLHIDGEGGLVHLRHALKGGPSIVLFGPTAPEFYGYPENINIKTLACPHWCDWVIDDWQTCCLNTNKHVCMKSITPDIVFSKVKIVFDMEGERVYVK